MTILWLIVIVVVTFWLVTDERYRRREQRDTPNTSTKESP